MATENAREIWSVDLGICRPGDFLHICTEPDNALRLTSNLPAREVDAVIRRALVDFGVLVSLRDPS